MPIRPKGATPAAAPTPAPEAPAAPATRSRAKPKTLAEAKAAAQEHLGTAEQTPIEKAIEETPAAAPAATPAARPARIKTAAQRAAEAAEQPVASSEDAAPSAAAEDDDSWMHSGADAEALAAKLAAEKEQAKEERRARGYWPIRFSLIAPTPEYPDRYQADILLLDDKPSNAYWEHVLRNSRTGQWDVIEPCPKEYDNCPLCPPGGEKDSNFVILMSALNLNGYTVKRGARAGQHIPITKELIVPWVNDHAFFHKLREEHGSLRGIQLTMTRSTKFEPQIGVPTFVGKFTEQEIEAYIREQGMWAPKVTQDGEKIGEEDWLMHPFNYKEFLHKPSGADLRARYTNGAGAAAPIGARTQNDPEWGNSRYAPNAAGAPRGGGLAAGAAATGRSMDDLEDDVPF